MQEGCTTGLLVELHRGMPPVLCLTLCGCLLPRVAYLHPLLHPLRHPLHPPCLTLEGIRLVRRQSA